MTDHHDTAGATARPRLTPLENVLAFMKLARRQGTTMSIWADDVKAVEDAINEHEPLKARLAEVEGERDEARAALGRIAQPDDLAADPSNFGAFAEAYLNFAQHIARTALAEQKED